MKLASSLSILLVLGCAAEDEPLDTTSSAAEEEGQQCRTLLDRVSTPTGSTVDFCAYDGGVAVIERAPLHTPGYVNELERHWRCPSDLYAELTGGREAPVELEEDCRLRTESGRSTGKTEKPLVSPRPTRRSHFCAGSSGDDEFVSESCSKMESNAAFAGWYDSMWWCRAAPATKSQRTATSQLGHKGDKIRVLLASCNGTSNYRLSHYAGGWDTEVDTDVLSGYWVDGSLYTNLTDQDLRFDGDAYGSAWYRYTGMFGDFEWP